MPFDPEEPYAVVNNDPTGRVYEQGGVSYRADHSEWTAPATVTEEVARMVVNAAGAVTGIVRPGGVVASIASEGGASAFTDLTDAPGTILANGIPYGNDAGTALLMSDIISINENGVFEITENGDSGIAVQANGDGGLSIQANGSGGFTLSGSEVSLDAGTDNTLLIRCAGAGIGQIVISASTENGILLQASGDGPIAINPNGAAGLKVSGSTAVATQSVLVAGVGTMVFTHGILTSFTPA